MHRRRTTEPPGDHSTADSKWVERISGKSFPHIPQSGKMQPGLPRFDGSIFQLPLFLRFLRGAPRRWWFGWVDGGVFEMELAGMAYYIRTPTRFESVIKSCNPSRPCKLLLTSSGSAKTVSTGGLTGWGGARGSNLAKSRLDEGVFSGCGGPVG
jgi:hypothetical protein